MAATILSTMRTHMPLVVLGFGRSGSTWVADVLARLSGGIVLNEPLNPCMGFAGNELVWREPVSGRTAADLDAILDGLVRAPWLLRAEFAPLATADHQAIGRYWDTKPIVGLKETFHACTAVPWMLDLSGGRLAFVAREPLPTISSVLARPTFWALGWSAHSRMILDASLWSPAAEGTVLEELRRFDRRSASYLSRVALCWAAMHAAAFLDLAAAGVNWWDYEDLVDSPGAFRALCAKLDVPWDAELAMTSQASRTRYGRPTTLTIPEQAEVMRIVGPVLDMAAEIRPA